MEKNFKALGFELKFATGEEADKLNAEMLNDEIKNLQMELDAKTPKKEKNKNVKDILNDSEIPYETRMKYIIEAYRKDQEKWGKLYDYAKHLEKEVIRLKSIIVANGYTDKLEGIEIKNQGDLIDKLYKKIRTLKDEKRNLETKIKVEFPDRRYNLIRYVKEIRNQNNYIKGLQQQLQEHGITYEPQPPVSDFVKESVEKLDEKGLKLNI